MIKTDLGTVVRRESVFDAPGTRSLAGLLHEGPKQHVKTCARKVLGPNWKSQKAAQSLHAQGFPVDPSSTKGDHASSPKDILGVTNFVGKLYVDMFFWP